jgi:soluble lytic murein transglycosylase-like protein
MDMRRSLIGCAAMVLLGTAAATPASAQIYSWRDANGNLVLSGTKPQREVKTYAVPEAETVRVTRPVTIIASGRNAYYDELIDEHARRHGIRTDLVKAVVHVESGYNPYAKSRKGALGLMQLMPATIREYGVANPFNPVENIRNRSRSRHTTRGHLPSIGTDRTCRPTARR